ncbi:kinase-like domain-containing protein [Absidia repens]|uniref:Kinase-like domain-containing protein n=1 Tax=Absidia repens TaxID=90262 RepID=A0A1X2IGJ6_9FUNG|nr:kinase-like domain-containing protein [Absidia repens]
MNHIIEKLKAHHLAGEKEESQSEPTSVRSDWNKSQADNQQSSNNEERHHFLPHRRDNESKLTVRDNGYHKHYIPPLDLNSHSLAASIHHLVHWRPHPSHRPGKAYDASSVLHSQMNARLDRVQSETCLHEKYGDADQFIGKGSFGTVRLVKTRDSSNNTLRSSTNTSTPAKKASSPPPQPSQQQQQHNTLYAVKEIKKSPNETNKSYVNRVTEEFLIASKLMHPNIVACVDLLPLQSHSDTYCQVMEYCNAGDLYEHIAHIKGPLHYIEALCFFKQLVHGVHYLHTNGLAHRDIKPENLLLTSDGCLKISDFGAADYFLDKDKHILGSTGVCGSQPYIAPEEFDNSGPYDARKVDVWSCGIVFLVMRKGGLAWQVARAQNDKQYALYLLYRKYVDSQQQHHPDIPHQPSPAITASPDESASTTTTTMSERSTPTTTTTTATTNTTATDDDKPTGLDIFSDYSPPAKRIFYSVLDPDPASRLTMDDIIKTDWFQQINCCH